MKKALVNSHSRILRALTWRSNRWHQLQRLKEVTLQMSLRSMLIGSSSRHTRKEVDQLSTAMSCRLTMEIVVTSLKSLALQLSTHSIANLSHQVSLRA